MRRLSWRALYPPEERPLASPQTAKRVTAGSSALRGGDLGYCLLGFARGLGGS